MTVGPPNEPRNRFVLRRLSNIAVTLTQETLAEQIGGRPNFEEILFE